MAAYVWTGGVDNDWAVNGNWDIAGWPTAGDNATINIADTCNLNIAISVATLTLNHIDAILTASANLTVTTGITLTAGTFRMGSYTHSIAGSWTKGANYTTVCETSKLLFPGLSALTDTSDFYDVEFEVGGAFGAAGSVLRDLIISGGT